MRVAHVVNTAQNAFLLARFQRAQGLAADSYDFGGGNPMQVPWWEEAVFDETEIEHPHYDWLSVRCSPAYRRPAFAKILGTDTAAPWYDTQEDYQAALPALLPALAHNQTVQALDPDRQRRDVRQALRDSRLSLGEQAAVEDTAVNLPSWRSVRAIAARYDLTVLYGPAAGYACLLPRDARYIAFEHATMRYVHRLLSGDDRLLAAAYRHADACVITNADCKEAADCLGLDNATFIPHPLDETTFSPGPPRADTWGPALRAHFGVDLLLYAPARHSMNESSGTKRNERILYAFARYLAEAEPNGAPKALLLLARWGQHTRESERLIASLGIAPRVKWSNCLPKRKARDLYRAADLVLDQFSETVGSFGTVTAEAMACGKPVITYVNPRAHDWCLSALPPVANALTSDDVYRQLVRLATRASERERLGAQGRRWILDWHAAPTVIAQHLALYERVLNGATPSTPAAAPLPLAA